METTLDIAALRDVALAVLIGALVGLEREKRKLDERASTIGGLRTFTLIALAGAVSAWLTRELDTPWIFTGMLGAMAAVVITGYRLEAGTRPDSLGSTTEIAALVVFVLAGLTVLGSAALGVGLGIVTAAALAYKQPLHGFVERIGWDDLFAGLRLLIASFIVLPLLPDRTIDPLDALNPYKLWLLVILISALSLAGYVATRILGPGRGIAVTGLTGGLASSTAVTLSLARRTEERDQGADALSCGILLAWAVMFVRVLVTVVVVNPNIVARLAAPFGMMALASAACGAWFYRKAGKTRGVEGGIPLSNPFRLTQAVKFALLFAAVLVVVKLAQRYLPGEGVYFVAALAGLTDVDAITLSMAQLARDGGDAGVAVGAIAIASWSNTLVKCGMVVVLADRALRTRIVAATLVILALGVAALLALRFSGTT